MKTGGSTIELSFAAKVALCGFALLFALFGLLTIQYAAVILTTGMPWLQNALDHLSIYATGAEPGLNTIEQSLAHYRNLAGSMSTHTFVGGLVMLLGSIQFVPGIRRQHRQLHRINGAALAIFMTTVSITGLYFLYHTPLRGVLAGEAFYIALAAVALLSLGLLYQAGLAIAARDFRGHMIWMSLAFSCFLTAPLLRLNYLAVASWQEQYLNRVVQNSSPTILAQAFVLIMLWFVFVGDKDLPHREAIQARRSPTMPIPFVVSGAIISLWLLCGLLLTQNLDNHLRQPQTWGALLLVLVAASKTWQVYSSAQAWKISMDGGKPNRSYAWSTVVSSIALLMLAGQMKIEGFYAQAIYFALLHLALMEVFLLLLAFVIPALSTGRALFCAASAAFCWHWPLLLITTATFWFMGFTLDTSLTIGLGLAPAMLLVFAVASASKLTFRFNPLNAIDNHA
ncbi:MAG TPA: DUF2306 domain-containing protein [Limnobacter sp.]|nr:DUF2306 domain-containing protein [Limnobacter sp.]